MINETVMIFAIGVVIGVAVVTLYTYIRLRSMLRTLDQVMRQAQAEVEDMFVGLIVEKENGTYYCYRETDRQFLCQGATVAEVQAAFGAQYPAKTAYVADATAADIRAELVQVLNKK